MPIFRLKFERYLRPPGAHKEEEFIKKCIRCGKCQQVCPYNSIILTSWENPFQLGLPYIDARKKPCYLCMKCPPVCPTGALDRNLKDKERVRMGIAKIDKNTCWAYQGSFCRACYLNCPIFDKALKMTDELLPVVVEEYCVGCGVCEHVCPVEPSAIVVYPPK